MRGPVRVMLVDSQTLFAEGLQALLAHQPAVDLLGHVRSAEELIEALPGSGCDVVLVERHLPGIDSREITRQVNVRHPEVRVIGLSGRPDDVHAAAMCAAGAMAAVTKQHTVAELVQIICEVAQQDPPAPPPRTPPLEMWGQVTPRERQVLTRVAAGANTKEIGIQLGISPKTVHVHRASAMRKLGLRGVADVVRWALRHNLVSLGD